MEQQEIEGLQMRSLHSRDRVRILFENKTSESRVNLLWLNFRGEEVDYGVLEPGETMHMNTFQTHPWTVRTVNQEDNEDEEHTDVFFCWPDRGELRPVFEAQKFAEFLFREGGEEVLEHLQHFLNGTLRMSIQIRNRYNPTPLVDSALSSLVAHPGVTGDTIGFLELPKTLADKARSMMQNDGAE